ncbi:MAG: hypothetical protein OQK24_04920 [Magnetovibrio sp.]|nr:hypothetical protein [Magnetovibrio sp.]
MLDAQYVFVTEDARVMAKFLDGHMEDVTETLDLLPNPRKKFSKLELDEKRRALLLKFAA